VKVCLVNKFHYKKGGSETYYFTAAAALKAKGHEVVFFAMKDKKNIPCEQEKYFVSNASAGGGIKSKLNMILHITYSKEAYMKMKRLLEDEKPDLLILNLVHKQITLSVIDAVKDFRKKTGMTVKIFWTMHDLIAVCPSYTMLDGKGNLCEKCLKGSFKPCVDNKCIKGSRLMSMLSKYEADYIKRKNWYDDVDLFICPSEFYKKKLDEAGFTRKPIVVIRNLLPFSTVYEFGDTDDAYILYFGRLSSEKGVKTLIEAGIKTGVKLVILGTGPMEAELKKDADRHGNVEFMGFQTGQALTDYVRRCKCAVLPSEWYENGPYSAMEAMALGKPLIVSDKGGLPELVEDGVNGYVYRGGVDELAKNIEKMMALDEKQYKRMAKNSLDKAKALFDAASYVNNIEKYWLRASQSEC
jgi:glycosyltransferase involved in cell wall biosynthesis